MGNGGCGCSTRNFNVVFQSKISANEIKHSQMIKRFHKLEISNFSLTVDANFCKAHLIGPYFLSEVKMEKSYESIYKIFRKEILISIQGRNLKPSLNNSQVMNETTPILDSSRSFIHSELDFNNIFSQESLKKLVRKIESVNAEKMSGIFFYCWDNSLRLLYYFLFLPEINTEIPVIKEILILKENSPQNTGNGEDNYLISQIERDVVRTFPHLKIFEEQIFRDNLTDTLSQISIYDKELSYVQGMNFMLAYTLMLTGNDKNLAINYFRRILRLRSEIFGLEFRESLTEGFKLLHLYVNKLTNILKIHNPSLTEKLQFYEINEYIWFSKWLQTLFTFKFKFELVTKLWDFIIFYGLDYILLISLAVLDYFRKDFDNIKSIEEFIQICEKIYSTEGYDSFDLISFIFNKIKSKPYINYLQ